METQAIEFERNGQRNIILLGLGLIIFLLGFTTLVVRNILESLNRLKLTMSSSIEENEYLKVEIIGNDEITDVSMHYNTLIGQLEDQYNIRLGLNDLSNAISGDLSLESLSRNALSVLSTFTKSGNGVIYLYDAEQAQLNLIGTYAFTEKQKLMNKLELGESLIGQVALDKKVILLKNITQNEGLINTGITCQVPLNIIGIPLVFEDQLCGVIELASFEGYEDRKINFLKLSADMIATSIYATIQREKIHILLDEARKTNVLLKSQHEELQQNNEELEEQSRTLRESEVRLQLQQEELKVTNEELEVHSKQLEAQKRALDGKNRALASVQEELVKKATDLETTNKYKTQFLANMSHELRTPLNSIMVLSQLLMDKGEKMPLTRKEIEFASTIHSAGEDLLVLINGVLDLAKVEAGKLNIQIERVYFKDILEENQKLFDSMAHLKSLELNFSIDPNLPEYIESDKLRINQIVRNLISNAIKFTEEGSVSVRFRNLSEEEVKKLMITERDHIGIEVSDTGIGIPIDKMDEVFEAFKQSDGTASRRYGGTGLGLTIALEIARLLGGTIIHESEENKGSQFVLVLPSRLANQGLSNPFAVKEDDEEFEIKVKGTVNPEDVMITDEKRMLIIEDDAVFANVIAELAEEKGYRTTKVNKGRDGFNIAKELQPIGIILDIGLPDMDGMLLAKMLSEDKKTQNIPIHIISGDEAIFKDSTLEKMPRSVIGFLKKPVDIKSIYKTLSMLESIDMKGTHQLLIVGNCGDEAFEKFAQLGQFSIKKVLTGKEAFTELESQAYGCIILDIKLSDISGVDFMKTLRNSFSIQTPIIIYTDEEIESSEIDNINRYAETIILKSQRSKERLVDEVSLFLFDINKNTSDNASTMVIDDDNKEAVSGACILLVDDDSRNIFALTHLLEQNGLQIITAKDGIEAIEKFEKNEIDLIIMDIMMPRLDGFGAMKAIRKTIKGHEVPIIALTAKAMTEDRENCINAGANDYLIKPVNTQKLLSLIKVWLS